jgi:cytochrome c-type biogenesis protein CcmF
MNDIQYIGEHLLPGRIGHLLIVVSFVAALFGAISFYLSLKQRKWSKIGVGYLWLHVISTFAAIGILFYIVLNRFYEYHYAYKVASDTLPFKYIFSGFWQDQEGSFLLWMFWHGVLLLILLLHRSKFRNGVLLSILTIQAVLATMLLGIYIPGTSVKFGINPFELLRETMDIPLFANADYVSLIQGQGLNPLLQNYWNVIHPPTLFLGFASGILPFAFAVSGLLNRDHKAWMKVALPWILWAAAIFGTGILMGAAWAYEALSFGGYWAWDPVENSSLVPWILQIAALHTILISLATNRNILTSYMLSILSFVFILYSTFLTRSGVLGDTSVHAFTAMGLEWQLIGLMGIALLPTLGLTIYRKKEFPGVKKEEHIASKEFWLFIGVLVLIFSAFLIIFTTSIPVFNKLMDAFGNMIGSDLSSWHRTAPIDPEAHYNKYQIWIAIMMGLLSAGTQWLRFREQNWKIHGKKFIKHLVISTFISLILTGWICWKGEFEYWPYRILMFAGIFTMVANLEYLFFFLKKRQKQYGSVVAHFGFGLMLVGILFSGSKKRFISNAAFLQQGLIAGMSEEENRKNVVLFKDSPLIMENYQVTYLDDSLSNHNRYFHLKYKELNNEFAGVDSFEIKPHIIYSKDFAKVQASNPFTKRYFNEDIFSYISSVPAIDPETQRSEEDSIDYQLQYIALGDTLKLGDGIAILEEIHMDPSKTDIEVFPGDILFEAIFKYKTAQSDRWENAKPAIILRGNTVSNFPDRLNRLWSKVKWSDLLWEELWNLEKSSSYEKIILKQGETSEYGDIKLKLISFSRGLPSNRIETKEGDIALSAFVEVSDKTHRDTVQPIYLIRGKSPILLKEYLPEFQMNLRFTKLDPEAETAEFAISVEKEPFAYPFLVAENAGRKDYIVLQVMKFPWINLFWLGTVAMMAGLFYSSFVRRRYQ